MAWTSTEHALAYLARADSVPHRTEGEGVLLDHLPPRPQRVLDIGAGDGRLLDLVLTARPNAQAVALDFSPPMLARARERFAARPNVEVVDHDFEHPLPALGAFDVIVSSFAIHHVGHERKRALYAEVFALLTPGGLFANLEHVASPTPQLHTAFLEAAGFASDDEDPSNQLLDMETQLGWLREIGFRNVDCYWKWLELALLAGVKPE